MNLVGVAVLCVIFAAIGAFFGFVKGCKTVLKQYHVLRETYEELKTKNQELNIQLLEATNIVDCPVCNGSGESSTRSDNECQCCFGSGSITEGKYNAIQQVKGDLKKKMNERGIEL